MQVTQTGNDQNQFEEFIDRYSPSVFTALSKLTGITDEKELEKMTIAVFVDIWGNSDELFKEVPPTAFIYKIVLQHVFSYLKDNGRDDKILLLRNTLLIDPAHYMPIIGSRPADGE